MVNELRTDNDAPWKQRFRVSTVLWTQLAKRNPTRGIAVSNRSGIYQLYAWDVSAGQLTQLTNQPEGLLFGIISPDGQYVYYLADYKGNEIGHYVRIPFTGGTPQDITPAMPPYASWSLAISLAVNRIAFNWADAQGFHLCGIAVEPDGTLGIPRPLYQSNYLTLGPVLSADGRIVVVASSERTGMQHYSLIAIDTETGQRIGELWDGPNNMLEASTFSPIVGDARLLGASNQTGFKKPLLWNPVTGERIDLPLESIEGAVVPIDWAADGTRILLCQFHHARQQFYIYHLDTGSLTKLQHPAGAYTFFRGGTYFGPSGEIFAQWQDSTHPPQLIALDSSTGVQTRVVLPAGAVPPSRPWRSVTFPSSDGEMIQGWLGVPEGQGPFPTILHTHGGPETVTMETFLPESQAWLDHGFAYLAINYRGSTTFGRAFQEKIWGNPGYWEVEDMVAARNWLIAQGIAHPEQIFLTGWSYGGYLTLQALGTRPELWAGGMAGVPVTDWADNQDEAETLKRYDIALMGGTPEEKPEQYRISSPITYVDQIKAPVLIIQGRNDTRCPARPVEAYEAKMKALGKSIEVHWFDAGHLSAYTQVERSIEHQEIMLRFAYRILHEKKNLLQKTFSQVAS